MDKLGWHPRAKVSVIALNLTQRLRFVSRNKGRRRSVRRSYSTGGLEAEPLALAFRRDLQPLRRCDKTEDIPDGIRWPDSWNSYIDAVHVTLEPGIHETYIYDIARNIVHEDMLFASHESLPNPSSTDWRPNMYTYEGLIAHPWGVGLDSFSDESSIDSVDDSEFYLGRHWVEAMKPKPIGILSETTRYISSPALTSWIKFNDDDVSIYSRRTSLFVSGWEWDNASIQSSDGGEVYELFKDQLMVPSSQAVTTEGALSDVGLKWQSSEDLDPERADRTRILDVLLEDMLQENLSLVPLSDFPVHVPTRVTSDVVASLGLPQIRPLTNLKAKKLIASDPAFRRQHTALEQPPYDPACLDLDQKSITGAPSLLESSCDAPPPFPQHSTEIVDLIRMAAILLHRETRSALIRRRHRKLEHSHSPIFEHLARLERLVRSWPDKDLSTAQGITVFKDALKDGIVLCGSLGYFNPLASISRSIPEKIVADNFRRFIDQYKSLNLPGMDTLDYISFVDSTSEELASYARAIIQVHAQLGLAPLDHDTDARSDASVFSWSSRRESARSSRKATKSLDWRSTIDHGGVKDDFVSDGVTTNSQDTNSSLLPEDEMLLYSQVASVVQDECKWRQLLHQDKQEAQSMIDIIQHLLTFPQLEEPARNELWTALIRLSLKTALYPRAFRLAENPALRIDKEPITCGAYGDIMRGYVDEQAICIKVVRLYREGTKSWAYLKSFMREIVIWGQLRHPNVLPFYGVYHLDKSNRRMCLISPWMENGNVTAYLKLFPSANKLLLVRDVASALEYLHARGIVHGDLKGANILVDLHGRAYLGDFGLASVNSDNHEIRSPSFESTGHQGATLRYEAPELLSETGIKVHRTSASDMYAFGSVCYEIFTGEVPFYEEVTWFEIIVKIKQGDTPTRPSSEATSYLGSFITDEVWCLLCRFWSKRPRDRPAATEVMSTKLFRDQVDLRPEREAWSPSRYRSALTRRSFEVDLGALEEKMKLQKSAESKQFMLIPQERRQYIQM